jgi:hypothetical protein
LLADTYPLAIVVEEGLELDNIRVPDNAHNLQFTVLCSRLARMVVRTGHMCKPTLKRLSCSTRLMAASSPLGDNFVWKTTPKEPFPTILHCVYARSLYSPVWPSWTFSRITSVAVLAVQGAGSEATGHAPPILSEEKADGRFWLIVWGYATGRWSARRCADCYWEELGLLELSRAWEVRRERVRECVVPGVVVGARCKVQGARWSGGEAVMPWCRVRLRGPDDTDTLVGRVWLRRMGKERLVSQAAMLRTGAGRG